MAIEPVTREEKFLASLTGGSVTLPDPITRKEMFLAAAAGMPVSVPSPITREEMFLSQIKPGDGSGVTIRNQNKTFTENGTYKADTGYTGLGTVTVNVPISEPVLEELTITENGEYTPGEGVDGFSKVVANVAGGGGADLLAARLTNTLTEYSNSEITAISDYAFYNCNSLKKIHLPAVTTIEDYAFYMPQGSVPEEYDFRAVTTINISGFSGLNLGDITDENFPNLYEIYKNGLRNVSATKIQKPDSTLKIHGTAFEQNALLEKVDIWAAEWGTNNQKLLFQNCPVFGAFIIRRTDAVNPWCGWSGAFNTTLIAAGTGYIYVPSALVDSYKATTGWADWAEQIRAIEDYPEITGG